MVVADLLRLAPLPAVLVFLWQAELGEDAMCELFDEIIDFFRTVVKGGHRGHHRGACVVYAHHIFEMNAIQRRLAQTQHERATLFQANVRGACEQIIRDAGRDCAECSRRAWDDGHAVYYGAA